MADRKWSEADGKRGEAGQCGSGDDVTLLEGGMAFTFELGEHSPFQTLGAGTMGKSPTAFSHRCRCPEHRSVTQSPIQTVKLLFTTCSTGPIVGAVVAAPSIACLLTKVAPLRDTSGTDRDLIGGSEHGWSE